MVTDGPRRDRAGARRHGRPQDRRRFPARIAPEAQVWISDPSWENHRALFEGAGFAVNTYRYYDAATHGLDFDGMIADLDAAPAGVDRRAARLLPQSDGRRSDPGAVAADHRSRARTRPRAVSRPRLSGLRATASTPTAPSCATLPRRRGRCSCPARSPSRSRCTASASARCPSSPPTRTKPRACCRRSSASSAPTIRIRRRTADRSSPPCSTIAGAARAVGQRARRDARPHPPLRAVARRQASRARCRSADFEFVLAQRGMFSYSGLTKDAVHRLRARILDLRDRHRPHLRRRAQLTQHRLRRGRDRQGDRLTFAGAARAF